MGPQSPDRLMFGKRATRQTLRSTPGQELEMQNWLARQHALGRQFAQPGKRLRVRVRQRCSLARARARKDRIGARQRLDKME